MNRPAPYERLAPGDWRLALKDVTSVTNARTVIMAAIPFVAAGHTLPPISPADRSASVKIGKVDLDYNAFAPLLLANFNSFPLDYLARQKVHGNHIAWYLAEQLPVNAPAGCSGRIGAKSMAQLARAEVLRHTYTAKDMRAIKAGDTETRVAPWDATLIHD